MPDHAQPHTAPLVLILSHGDQEIDRRIAPNGFTAVSKAMEMLARRNDLRPGDRLTVEGHAAVAVAANVADAASSHNGGEATAAAGPIPASARVIAFPSCVRVTASPDAVFSRSDGLIPPPSGAGDS
jgi:hypothetical protein